MKTIFFTAFLFLFLSCNHPVKSGNRLELSYDIERLDPHSQRAVADWEGYRDLENNMKLICNTNALNAVSFKNALKENIKLMQKKMPSSLRQTSVQQEINDIDNKVNSFCADIKDDELNQETVKEHLSEIVDAFEALNVSINQTIASL